ncbi:glycosyltransferase family 4 protein [Clostridium gasigenes]|uniref:Glycosyltransferase involved in cell wall bisynthesis n=1 Tax=Clostridium gasigenes TaxID=94869 RepID=A0A1H0TFG0_9CLOT|nr:glycosyltransferase family 4 protein [Clostridium gasigenes]MBU3090139.1 glycosyltransferase family 4 protein [Clostridium gasigenes]SDP52782.1 Glycosyltransferase involved in cell wall bisynthesis [Clostridium gasigenes]
MKILVVTQYFWPEEFRINDICEGLIEKGHEVEVLTGIPNYPYGKFYDGYSFLKKGKREYKGIKIKRVPIIPRGKDGFIKLALNYMSYTVSASIATARLLFNRYDRVFVFQLSPITLAIPGIIISKIKKIPSTIYIQDLWPESLYCIKEVSSEKVKSILDRLCMKIYNSFDNVLITSNGFKEKLIDRGMEKEKITYLPQWAEEFYRKENEYYNMELESEVLTVTFAGNIGKAQSVSTIIEAAKLAKNNKKIKWQIIGDGSEFENIKDLVKKYSLEETVYILGRKPAKDMPMYFSKANGLIVTLANEDILKATLPAKVQSYMASGKPIIAAISGEGNDVIKESCCGLVGEAEDYRKLYENVIELYNMNLDQRKKLGDNGKKFFEENFTREILLNKLNEIINI